MTTMTQSNSQWARKIAEHGIFIRYEDGDAPEIAQWRWRRG